MHCEMNAKGGNDDFMLWAQDCDMMIILKFC